jgi:hypothetical protein
MSFLRRKSLSGRNLSSLTALLVLMLFGAWPLVSLSGQTSERTWVLSGAALLLGAALTFWVWGRRMRRSGPGFGGSRRWLLFAALMLSAAVVAGMPAGVEMIYCAAVEGMICATAFLAVRVLLQR